MKFLRLYLQLLKKYPLARLLSLAGILLLAFAFTSLARHSSRKRPEILSLMPPVSSPGETVIIYGENFGSERFDSFVEISGSRITSSGYSLWTDNQIRIVLPQTVEDGLVTVHTSSGNSNPSFFAKQSGIPVAVRQNPRTSLPVIRSIEPASAEPGDTIVITGANFGNVRGTSQVYFSANRSYTNAAAAQKLTGQAGVYISANEMDFDYEYWSDSELHVRVPDGAATGSLYVQTANGMSRNQLFTVEYKAGRSSYSSSRVYVVQVNADIENRGQGQDSRITLYIPRPPVCASQPVANLTEVSPEPLIKNDLHDIIQQIDISGGDGSKQRFSQVFAVEVYAVTSGIDSRQVKRYSDRQRLLYSMFTSSDSCVPSSSPAIIQLVQSVVGREKNPYRQAKLIYDYIIGNFSVYQEVRAGNVTVLDMLEQKYGDAYDFAVMFTAMCRAAGIPALPVSGILVEDNATTRNHWWSEVYFEGYGWFPVDVALGAGLNFVPQQEISNKAEFYFGNMDNQHIIFSRGWTQIKPSLLNSKIVYRPRTYALQSVWEESSDSMLNYSSLWNNPTIIGIEQIH